MRSFICKRSFRVNEENCEKEKNLWTFVSFFSPWWHLLWPGPRLYIASQSSIKKRRQRRSVLALAWARAPSPSSFPNSSSFRKLHCLLMPSRLSPLQQTITTGTFTPFLHFVTFACNISCVIHRSNTTTILGWFPQSRFSLPLMSCMVSSGHFDLFVF